MTPDQASMLLGINTKDVGQEAQTTRKVLAAVPEDKASWTPYHEKAMSALDLAWHIASTEVWFLHGVAAGEFTPEDGKRPESVKTLADVVAYYDANLGPALEKAKGISGEAAAKIVDFYGAFQLPAVVYLSFLVKHSVHHRGQLSTYLRAMGAKVPSIYGGSADEPFMG
ncbi:MAG: DinB family protein [Bryobacterales bacterium]|nr:DinB family protein [Bryobacterales bacterium]